MLGIQLSLETWKGGAVSFIDHIRKIQTPKSRGKFYSIDSIGDPEALAVSFSNFKAEKEMRKIGIPRASSLYDACMRKHVIGTVLELEEPQWLSIRDRIIYGIGIAVHKWIQNSPDLFGDGRYGWWVCNGCKTVRYFGAPPKKDCEKCGADKEASVYQEHFMRVRSPVLVNGHPDLFFRTSHMKKVRIAELKTVAGDEFDKLKAPRAADEWQLHTYMFGCPLDDSIPAIVDASVGYIVYITKKVSSGTFPLKIFQVRRDQGMVERIKSKLTLYKQGITNYPERLPPPIEECERSRFESYRAKKCVALEECLRHRGRNEEKKSKQGN